MAGWAGQPQYGGFDYVAVTGETFSPQHQYVTYIPQEMVAHPMMAHMAMQGQYIAGYYPHDGGAYYPHHGYEMEYVYNNEQGCVAGPVVVYPTSPPPPHSGTLSHRAQRDSTVPVMQLPAGAVLAPSGDVVPQVMWAAAQQSLPRSSHHRQHQQQQRHQHVPRGTDPSTQHLHRQPMLPDPPIPGKDHAQSASGGTAAHRAQPEHGWRGKDHARHHSTHTPAYSPVASPHHLHRPPHPVVQQQTPTLLLQQSVAPSVTASAVRGHSGPTPRASVDAPVSQHVQSSPEAGATDGVEVLFGTFVPHNTDASIIMPLSPKKRGDDNAPPTPPTETTSPRLTSRVPTGDVDDGSRRASTDGAVPRPPSLPTTRPSQLPTVEAAACGKTDTGSATSVPASVNPTPTAESKSSQAAVATTPATVMNFDAALEEAKKLIMSATFKSSQVSDTVLQLKVPEVPKARRRSRDSRTSSASASPVTTRSSPLSSVSASPDPSEASSAWVLPPPINPAKFRCDPPGARYFVVQATSEEEVCRSIQRSRWCCSSEHGNKHLSAAFSESSGAGPMFLLVSVAGSSHFCGLAEMTSEATRPAVTTAGARQRGSISHGFDVRWHAVKDVPHRLFAHLLNDDGRSVPQARDAQELLPAGVGADAVRILVNCRSEYSVIDAFVQFAENGSRRSSKGDGRATVHGGNALPRPARRRYSVPRGAGGPRRQSTD